MSSETLDTREPRGLVLVSRSFVPSTHSMVGSPSPLFIQPRLQHLMQSLKMNDFQWLSYQEKERTIFSASPLASSNVLHWLIASPTPSLPMGGGWWGKGWVRTVGRSVNDCPRNYVTWPQNSKGAILSSDNATMNAEGQMAVLLLIGHYFLMKEIILSFRLL